MTATPEGHRRPVSQLSTASWTSTATS